MLTVSSLLAELPETTYSVLFSSAKVKISAAMDLLAFMVGYAVRLSSVTLLPWFHSGSAVK